MTQPQTSRNTNTSAEARDQLFARFVADHARLLYRVAYAILRHPEDAEDAVQDALLKLYRTPELPALDNERAYLARVVWRTALDRKSSRKPNLDDETPYLPDLRPTPEAAAADELALLAAIIDALPSGWRLDQPVQVRYDPPIQGTGLAG